MGWAGAVWRNRTSLMILAALLLGLSGCGDTIPDTGGTPGTPADTLRLAPFENQTGGAAQMPATSEIFCPILRYPPLNDLTVYPDTSLSEPPPRAPFYDAVFGSCLARLTDRTGDRAPFDNSTGMHAPGSGVQAFNADSSSILIQSTGGYWYVYNAETLLPTLRLPVAAAQEVFWDPRNPQLLYFLRGTSLLRYSLVNEQEQLLHNFAVDFPNLALESVSAQGGSGVSVDGRTLALAGLDGNGSALFLLVYDLAADQVLAHQHFPAPMSLSGLRISPSGVFVLAGFNAACPEIEASGELMLCGLVSFNRDFSRAWQIAGAAGSFDTALDPQRREVVVYHDQAQQSISMYHLQTGEQRALLLVDTAPAAMNMEISGRALDRPGWAIASVYGVPAPGQGSWLDSTIMAFELKSDGLIARLAQNHSIYTDPSETGWVHPSASPNPDFTRVLFTSNWGSSTGEVEAYIIALPADWVTPTQ